ncbi:MAG: hypothetical protein ACFCUS_11990 [Rubrimonas sp.]|uniref:hypothetical protein n=1 Tax=Rubrimonas sp. TaxID=2036015 RepID=UPI002FDDEA18
MSEKKPARKPARSESADAKAARAARRLVEMPEPQIAAPRSGPVAPPPPAVEHGATPKAGEPAKRPRK